MIKVQPKQIPATKPVTKAKPKAKPAKKSAFTQVVDTVHDVVNDVLGKDVPAFVVPPGKKAKGPFVLGQPVELVDDIKASKKVEQLPDVQVAAGPQRLRDIMAQGGLINFRGDATPMFLDNQVFVNGTLVRSDDEFDVSGGDLVITVGNKRVKVGLLPEPEPAPMPLFPAVDEKFLLDGHLASVASFDPFVVNTHSVRNGVQVENPVMITSLDGHTVEHIDKGKAFRMLAMA